MYLPGGPTKDEVLAISLLKLDPGIDDVFADLGCGTGKVSLAVSPLVREVYAVDRREEAIEMTREQAEAAGLSNISCRHAEIADFLREFPDIDVAFVGGTQSLRETLGLLVKGGVRRVVVNAVLLESVHETVTCMRSLGIFEEIVNVQVSRGVPLGRGIMMKPLDPVFIITGGCGSCS